MNFSFKPKKSAVFSVLAALCGTLYQPAVADIQEITTTTTTAAPQFVVGVPISGQTSESFADFAGKTAVVVTSPSSQALIMGTTVSLTPIGLVTTRGAVMTGLLVFNPDDLLTRRDDLLARIAVERVNGKLSDEEANGLMARLREDDAKRSHLAPQGSTAFYKEVKGIYRDYDHVANAMKSDSKEGDKQLAGTYSCITF
jgi:hypothetical protein